MSEQIIRRFHPLTEHPNKFIGMTDARYGDYVRYSDHLASREADKAEIAKLGDDLRLERYRCGVACLDRDNAIARAEKAEARIAELEAALSDLKVKPPGLESYSDQFVDANKKVDADHVIGVGEMVNAEDEAVRRNAERYRWLRSRENSLERRQWDKRIDNGTSCYHIVDEIRELKWGADLDTAIDAAIAAAKESK